MINKAILMGRLTRDPELRHTGTGTPVCSFSIAITTVTAKTDKRILSIVLPGTKPLNSLQTISARAR